MLIPFLIIGIRAKSFQSLPSQTSSQGMISLIQLRPSYLIHLLIINPADVHIGKYADALETGEMYNVEIARKRVIEGVTGILRHAEGFPVDRILFCIGNDILHTDNTMGSTTRLTPQDTDGKWYRHFTTALELYVQCVEMLMQIAPVDCVHSMSNHDYMSGFHLAHALKKNALPLHMAQEEPQMWAKSKHRYWYLHHLHHKQRYQFMSSFDNIGVTIEFLRSPSGTDSWHATKGYTGSPKAVEGFIHSKENGQIAHLTYIF